MSEAVRHNPFVAATAARQAWADRMLAERLNEVSPLLRGRIRHEVRWRLLEPCRQRHCLPRRSAGADRYRGRHVSTTGRLPGTGNLACNGFNWDLNLNLTERIHGGNVGKMRTPLFSLPGAWVSDALDSGINLMPTGMELAGLPPVNDADGQSFTR